jgi:mRNA interferase YafQ
LRRIEYGSTFKRDFRRMEKRGAPIKRLHEIVSILANNESLPARCRPHHLSGKWSGFWECHIGPDWLLIYDLEGDALSLHRTGTHSDLFE